MHKKGLLKNIMNLIETNKKTAYVFVNFESNSFFNKYSLVKRDEEAWEGWGEIAKASDATLSSTQIPAKFAEYDYKSKNHLITYPTISKPVKNVDQRKVNELQIIGDYVISFVSNNLHKGIDRLIQFAKKGFNGYKLVTICGTSLDKNKLSQLEFACKESKTELLHFIRINEEEKYQLLSNAKALIYPTSFEGFGLPPLEALSVGTPVIAYKLDVLREIYSNSLTWIDDSLIDLNPILKNLKPSKKLTREINAIIDFDFFSADMLMNGLISIENKKLKESSYKPFKILSSKACYDQYASTFRLFIEIQSEGFPKVDLFLDDKEYKIDNAKQISLGRYQVKFSRYLPKVQNKNIKLILKDSLNKTIQKKDIIRFESIQLKKIKEKVKSKISFYPEFSESDFREFSNHLQRAKYYLIGNSALASEVTLYAPNYFYSLFNPNHKHMEFVEEANIKIKKPKEFDKDFDKEKSLYIWRKLTNYEEEKLKKLSARKKVYVETNNPDIAEYGKYSYSLWQNLSEEERSEILEFSHFNYKNFIIDKLARFKKSVVFCTGPSIEKAKNWNFSNCFRHVCNTTILDKELMNHIQPHIISAGDAISHLGISKYAQNFRNILIKYLRENDVIFFTTAAHGFRLFLKYPDLRKKIILCPQKKSEPNYNLMEQWWLPALDSILNIVLLPNAATISDKIYIIGADGKNPDESKNEDFWAHNKKTHFHDLVHTGHKCHPTFDINRKKTTLNRYLESCKTTINIGEEHFSKEYISLTPSFTKSIGDRYRLVEQQELDE